MRRLKNMFHSVVELREDPHHIALSFAIGVFLGFSPLLGLHTALGLILAFWLRLNKVAVLLGVYVNAPWVIAPYYAFSLVVGSLLLGTPGIELPTAISFSQLFSVDFWRWVVAQWPLLIPVFVGSTVLCTLFSLVAYWGLLLLLRRRRARPAALPKPVSHMNPPAPESGQSHDTYSS